MNIDKIKETWLWVQFREVRKNVSEVTEDEVWWLSCSKSWTSLSVIPGCFEYLSGELAIGSFGGYDTLWFSEEDPLLGVDKPVTVTNIGLTKNGNYLLEVIGQQSDRIKRKWEGKYSTRMRGFVTLVWREKL